MFPYQIFLRPRVFHLGVTLNTIMHSTTIRQHIEVTSLFSIWRVGSLVAWRFSTSTAPSFVECENLKNFWLCNVHYKQADPQLFKLLCLDCLALENEGTMIFRNVRNRSHRDTSFVNPRHHGYENMEARKIITDGSARQISKCCYLSTDTGSM